MVKRATTDRRAMDRRRTLLPYLFATLIARHVAGQALPPSEFIPDLTKPNFTDTALAPSATTGAGSLDLPEEPFLDGEKLKELPCVPEDFVRMLGDCQGGTAQLVNYVARRECAPVFSLQPHTESCGCTPDDLWWRFDKTQSATGEEVCMRVYLCKTSEVGKHKIDMLHCQSEVPISCQEQHLETMYRKCDFIKDRRTGQVISDKQAVEVVYYFRGECDPEASGSIRPPASAFIPCDTSCGAGSFLKGTICKSCPKGTYSLGGVVRYDRFETIDPTIFQSSCSYKRLLPGSSTETEKVNCTTGWYAEDFALEVGQFDYVNQWFPEECQADPNKDCHNNLEAVLSMQIDLVTEGYVKFNFSVNSEKGHDGLSFFIDTFEEPIMGLQSYEVVPRTVMFFLTQGRHRLYWVYSKDGRFTQGEDIAVIHSIEIGGMALNAFNCLECPLGFYSNETAKECEPCPVNSIADVPGTPQCAPCPADQFSVAMPRVKCFPKPPCNVTRDYAKMLGFCNAKTKTQRLTYVPTKPFVCQAGDTPPAPTQVPCTPCPPGFAEIVDENLNIMRCQECPQGFARSGDEIECKACPPGKYAPKQWSLMAFNVHNLRFPPGMSSFCHGACGTIGWRVMSNHIDSGRHHGDGAQVFLLTHTNLAAEGSVWFNFSADMSAGPKKRGFFFYIDDNIVDFVQDDESGSISADAVRESGPWSLPPGKHKLMWEWMRIAGEAPTGARDNAIIYDIIIKGTVNGYAPGCEDIPPGSQLDELSKGIMPCPAGTFSEGRLDKCHKCKDNYISKPGAVECTPCGPGTSAKAGDADCFIGSVNDVGSFCSYFDTSNAPESFENITEIIEYYFYDLSPLNRLSLVHPFGPVRDENAPLGQTSMYYINVCNRDEGNTTCRDINGKGLGTYACQVRAEQEVEVGHSPAVDLGRSVSLHTLAEHGRGLGGRGLTLRFEGDLCPKTGVPRTMNITMLCSPKSGFGLPTHWTEEGKRAAYDLHLKYPSEWVTREGAPLPIEDRDSCFHDLVWYSEIACHECSWNDYEEVRVNDCKEDKMYTYRWKENLACLPTEKAPLPNDILCQACIATDYVEMVGTCSDMMGNHNITYTWAQPKVCSSFLEGAVPLPGNVLAGPCVQEFMFVPSKILSPKFVFVFALLGVLLVVMLVIWLVAFIKHRRIKQFYSKLVESEEQEQEMAEIEDDVNGEEQHLHR